MKTELATAVTEQAVETFRSKVNLGRLLIEARDQASNSHEFGKWRKANMPWLSPAVVKSHIALAEKLGDFLDQPAEQLPEFRAIKLLTTSTTPIEAVHEIMVARPSVTLKEAKEIVAKYKEHKAAPVDPEQPEQPEETLVSCDEKARQAATGARVVTGDALASTILDDSKGDASTSAAHAGTDNRVVSEHGKLFAIPEPKPTADSQELEVPTLPDPQPVTGNREVDAWLWLKEVCKTTTNEAVLDLVEEAAGRLKSSMEELKRGYIQWFEKQPENRSAFLLAMVDMEPAEINNYIDKARNRLQRYREALAQVGTVDAVIDQMPPERMLHETTSESVGPMDSIWDWGDDRLTQLFEHSINPISLTEVVSELEYWNWLGGIRRNLEATLGDYWGDGDPLVSARTEYLERLLCRVAPSDNQETKRVLDALDKGLLCVADYEGLARKSSVYRALLQHLTHHDPSQA